MIRRRIVLLVGSIVILSALVTGGSPFVALARSVDEGLPTELADQEFWKIVGDFSEANGSFRSDNLLSNESWLQYVIPDLMKAVKPGRVYLGVGPEQNFTYIAAVKPAMAFIIDIRRGNLDLQLLYKALFELSGDRAEFISKLFARKRPEGLTAASSIDEIFAAYADLEKSEDLYRENVKAVEDLLTRKHGFAMSADDISGLEYVYNAFTTFGPRISYSSTGGFGGFGRMRQPTYSELMMAKDGDGTMRGYLVSEENYERLRQLERRNLIVPLVGNFAGPRAIRSVGQYLKDRDALVSAFYLSNVEMYLMQDGLWGAFCANVATLPLDETSTFIRSLRGGRYGLGIGLNSELGAMATEVKTCPAGLR